MQKVFFIVSLLIVFVSSCSTTEQRQGLQEKLTSLQGECDLLRERLTLQEAQCAQRNEGYITENERLLIKEAELTEANTSLMHEAQTQKIELVKEITDLKARLKSCEIDSMRKADQCQESATAKDNRDIALAQCKEQVAALESEGAKCSATLLECSGLIGKCPTPAAAAPSVEQADTQGLYEAFVVAFEDEIGAKKVSVARYECSVVMTIFQRALFDPGSLDIKPDPGKVILDRACEVIRKSPGLSVRVEGHTDSQPMAKKYIKKFPSNWELSSERALALLKYIARGGCVTGGGRLNMAAFAGSRPAATNNTPEGRALNRRMELHLIPQLPER